jgi:hypothetical protein
MTIILLIIFIVLIILAVMEAGMYFLVHHPGVLKRFPRRFRNSITYLYIQGDRKIMHFQDGCGVYSPELGYTLKPGSFRYSEIEFTNEYRVNSLGVRDEEKALTAPDIIFLGDSFTVGWGVNHEETFAYLLGKKTKLKTLNTAIPSYGTVREMLMLRKVDRSALKCLILQYCDDDYDENRLYYLNGNRPQILRAETFKKYAAIHGKPKTYYPGKYLHLKINKKLDRWKAKPAITRDSHPLSDLDLFLHVLKQNEDLLAGVPMIVFEMNGVNQTNAFVTALKKKTADPNQAAFIRNLMVLDMSQYLEDRHFLVLDGHLNPFGQKVVANVLYETMLKAGILQRTEDEPAAERRYQK